MEQRSLDPAPIYSALGLKAPDEAFVKAWGASQTTFPHTVPFLKSEYVRESCRTLRIKQDLEDVLVDSLAMFDEHPPLRQLAWHFHRQILDNIGKPPFEAGKWPELPEQLGPRARLFYVIVWLSGVPAIREFHRSRGIPDAISIDSLNDLGLWTREQKRLKGYWSFAQNGWLAFHFTGSIYKLGRLQFEWTNFNYDFAAYRNVASKAVVVLAGSGQKFRRDGQFDGANGITDPQAFTSEFSQGADEIRGTPINPRGFAEALRVTLPSKQWKRVFGKGSPILSVHIDNNGPMDHAACGESFAQAGPFFKKHFPERAFDAYACMSWLMDPQFEDYLPADANIVRFLSEYYLFPYPKASDAQHYERIFDGPVADLDKAPQKSSLQKAIIAHEKAGKKWRHAGGIILADDLAWGRQVYRAKA